MQDLGKRVLALATKQMLGSEVVVAGWVSKIRDHGGLIFIDLRDWSGLVQLVVDKADPETFNVAQKLSLESVIKASGTVENRAPDLVNPNLQTGDIEINLNKLELINSSKTMPFPVDGDGHEIDESVRLKYRYIDIRRERLKNIMQKRSDMMLAIRKHMNDEGFLEVQTPLLTSTSPEGARDFLVPSRVHQGKFFVLPQAPQQFKQLLMVGGVDRYYQIAPCFRDEDPRADRHAGEFYQVDVEMSFPTIDEIFTVCENLIKETYKVVAPDKEIAQFPFPRIAYKEAMDRYGSDKPDIRFDLEIKDITELVKGRTEFNVFNNAEVIKCIVIPQVGEWSRTQILELEELAKQKDAKGLAYVKVGENSLETGVAKFLEPLQQEFVQAVDAKSGDIVIFVADSREIANKALGHVRSHLGDILNLKDPNKLSFAWITDFPFYEKDEKTGKLDFAHNPFSMPIGGMEAFAQSDPLEIQANQYDLALNGFEILSGSIRNHDPELLVKAFEVVGYDKQEVIRRFGGLYNAFQYGAPPHGGFAIGFDRFFMVLMDEPNIRDAYAFPKNSNGMDLMMDSPSEVPQHDLDVLGIMHQDQGNKVMALIKSRLDEIGAEYRLVEHEPVRTSEQAAKVRGSKLSDAAKAMVLKSEEFFNKYLMVVIPADRQLNLDKVSSKLNEKFRVATEEEVVQYTGIKVGGVPPFGRLLGMEVYFDKSLYMKDDIVFNCGRKDRSIFTKSASLVQAVQPHPDSENSDFID